MDPIASDPCPVAFAFDAVHPNVPRVAMSAPPISVACCINEGYVLPLAVMLSTLAARADTARRVVVHLLHEDLREESLATLGSLVDVRPVRLSAQSRGKVPRSDRFPPEAAAPLLLADALPREMGRLIFIDADVLVLSDLGALWDHDLHGKAIAAVRDAAIPQCSSWRGVKGWRQRGIPTHHPYFNAGVMLLDLHAWRDRRISERALSYLHEVGDRSDFLHQEALNAVAWSDWDELPARWNLPSSAGRSFDRTSPDAATDPALVHFSGRMKPWKVRTGSRFDAEYRNALARLGSRIASPHASSMERACGLYDRSIRPACYPLERALWALRLI